MDLSLTLNTDGSVSGTWTNPAPAPTPTPPPSPSTWTDNLGVYCASGSPADWKTFTADVAKPVPWAMAFTVGTDWASIAGTWPASAWKGSGANLLLGVDMIANAVAGSTTAVGYMQGVANGTYDSTFAAVAKNCVANGFDASNMMWRIGWEFNLGWAPWSSNSNNSKAPNAALFVAAYKRIVDVARTVIPNLQFMWNPSRGDNGVGNLANYYPGSSYASVVALDVYDEQWGTTPTEPSEMNLILTEPYGLDWLVTFAASAGAKCGLGEWGLWKKATSRNEGLGDDPYFITQMLTWIKANGGGPCVFWNNGMNLETSYPNSLAAFKSFS